MLSTVGKSDVHAAGGAKRAQHVINVVPENAELYKNYINQLQFTGRTTFFIDPQRHTGVPAWNVLQILNDVSCNFCSVIIWFLS